MHVIRELENHFFIDLCARRVYCRPCGNPCRSLVCRNFIQFWCATHECPNTGDVKLFMDGTWQVFGYEEEMGENLVSTITPKLLHSIVTGRSVTRRR